VTNSELYIDIRYFGCLFIRVDGVVSNTSCGRFCASYDQKML